LDNSETPEEFQKKYKENIKEEHNINLLQAASNMSLTKLAQTSTPKRVWDSKKPTSNDIAKLKKDLNKNIKSQNKMVSFAQGTQNTKKNDNPIQNNPKLSSLSKISSSDYNRTLPHNTKDSNSKEKSSNIKSKNDKNGLIEKIEHMFGFDKKLIQ